MERPVVSTCAFSNLSLHLIRAHTQMIHSTLHRASGKSPWRLFCHSPSSSSHSRYVERDRYFHAASNRVPQDQTPTNWETSTSGHHCYRQQNTYPRQNRTTKVSIVCVNVFFISQIGPSNMDSASFVHFLLTLTLLTDTRILFRCSLYAIPLSSQQQHRMKIYYYNLKIYRIEIPDLNHLSTTQQHLTAF